ncbi:MAG: hypothetical protein Fur0041_02250 [Bacteroidia bacterium]
MIPFLSKYHKQIYIAGIMMLAAGLALSKFLLSVSLFVIGINWLLEGRYSEKWRLFSTRPAAWLLMIFFLIHVAGVFWAPDSHEAWRDVRIKLPMLIIPFVISTSPVFSKKMVEYVLLIFAAGVLISTFYTFLVAAGVIYKPIANIREASRFVSLIRLSLMAVFAFFLLARYAFRETLPVYRLLSAVSCLWILFFFVYMQSLTGIIVLGIAASGIILIMAFRSKRKAIAFALLIPLLTAAVYSSFLTWNIWNELTPDAPLDRALIHQTKTPRGHTYMHDYTYPMVENGNYVMSWVCFEELDSVWKKKSNLPFSGRDHLGNPLSTTIVRYLASKGLKKDADGLSALRPEELAQIEKGITNFKTAERNSLERRIYEVEWELYHFIHGGNPSGNSVAMRLQLAHTALAHIKNNPWSGLGTGGQRSANEQYYATHAAKLDEEFSWLHAHNQFLSVAATLGIPALLFFIFTLIYPPFRMNRWGSYLYLAFLFVVLLSFFTDDTLETQQGVMFYAFFNSFLLFALPGRDFNYKGDAQG